jgi:hypothetical protein
VDVDALAVLAKVTGAEISEAGVVGEGGRVVKVNMGKDVVLIQLVR